MRLRNIGAAAILLPLLILLSSRELHAQERSWEILTLFGGDDSDTFPFALLHDAKRDRIIIAGRTQERDLPVTPDAMKSRLNDMMDGFIAVFNADCSELLYCSYVGGSENDAIIDGIILHENYLLLVLGTYSENLPTTGTAFLDDAPGQGDSWFCVVSLDTYRIIHAGYFGGRAKDGIDRIIRLDQGDIVITGHTASFDLPVTPNAFQPRKRSSGDGWDAFIAIFDSTFNLTYCSYHGGPTGSENGFNALAETENFIVFSGTVDGHGMPVTEDAYQKTFAGGYHDAYLVAVSKDSLTRVYSTYLGGSRFEYIHAIAAVGDDRIVFVGTTDSPDLPVTTNAWQSTLRDSVVGMSDMLLGVFDLKTLSFEEISYFGSEGVEYAKCIVENPGEQTVEIMLTSDSEQFPFLPSKPDDCWYRGAILTYDSQSRLPLHAVPVLDIANTSMQRMIRTNNGMLYYCGITAAYSKAGAVPVRSTGFMTELGGKRDVFIGILHDQPVSVDMLNASVHPFAGFEVYPQPARDELRFIVEDARDAAVTLHDLLGRKLREVAVSGGGRTHGRMSLQGIQPGMYMLLLRTADAVRAGKVMVTK